MKFYVSANVLIPGPELQTILEIAKEFKKDATTREAAHVAVFGAIASTLGMEAIRGTNRPLLRAPDEIVHVTITIDAPTGRADDISFTDPKAAQ